MPINGIVRPEFLENMNPTKKKICMGLFTDERKIFGGGLLGDIFNFSEFEGSGG